MKDIDVPIEEVNKVINKSEGEEGDGELSDGELSDGELSDGEEYIDLSEEAAKKELDTMIVPEIKGDEVEPELINTILAEKGKSVKPINLNLLQFQCSECDFKSYINLDDEIISPMAEKIKCINCGKNKSVKKRILNTTLNSFIEYKTKEEPYIDSELKEEDNLVGL
jgi:hypothetical protein